MMDRWLLRLLPIGALLTVAIFAAAAFLLAARSRDVENHRRAILHLCKLTNVNATIWRSAIKSYASLPRKTPDQICLLQALRLGEREIRADTSCPRRG